MPPKSGSGIKWVGENGFFKPGRKGEWLISSSSISLGFGGASVSKCKFTLFGGSLSTSLPPSLFG
jgi:hypothetical protein